MSEPENNLIIKLQFAESVIRDQDAMLAKQREAIEKTIPVLEEAMDLLSWLKHDAYQVIKGDYNGKIPCCQHDGETILELLRSFN